MTACLGVEQGQVLGQVCLSACVFACLYGASPSFLPSLTPCYSCLSLCFFALIASPLVWMERAHVSDAGEEEEEEGEGIWGKEGRRGFICLSLFLFLLNDTVDERV